MSTLLELATMDELFAEMGKRCSNMILGAQIVDEDSSKTGCFSLRLGVTGDVITALGLLEAVKIRMIESSIPAMVYDILKKGPTSDSENQ